MAHTGTGPGRGCTISTATENQQRPYPGAAHHTRAAESAAAGAGGKPSRTESTAEEVRRMTPKEIARYHKSNGRCQHCGKMDARTMVGGFYCFDCLEVQRRKDARHRERYNKAKVTQRSERRDRGLCTNCGGPRDDPALLTCSGCRNKKKRKPKLKMDRWGTDMCGRCLKNPRKPGYKICDVCLEKNRRITRERKWIPAPDHPWRISERFAANNRKSKEEFKK